MGPHRELGSLDGSFDASGCSINHARKTRHQNRWFLGPQAAMGAIKALYIGDIYHGSRLLPDPLGAMNAHASCPEEAKKPAGRTPKTHGRNTRRGPGGGRGGAGGAIGNFLRFLLR
jgi:hypothetical protein